MSRWGCWRGGQRGWGGPTKWVLERPSVACQNPPEFGIGMPIMSRWGCWTRGQGVGEGGSATGLPQPPFLFEGERGPRLPYQPSASPPPPPPLRTTWLCSNWHWMTRIVAASMKCWPPASDPGGTATLGSVERVCSKSELPRYVWEAGRGKPQEKGKLRNFTGNTGVIRNAVDNRDGTS